MEADLKPTIPDFSTQIKYDGWSWCAQCTVVRYGSLRLSLEQEVGPSTDFLLPQDGFEVGISCVPKIGYSQMWKYLIEEVEFKKQLSVEKPIVKTSLSLVKY